MIRLPALAVSLLVTTAVAASGCGSSEHPSTSSTTAANAAPTTASTATTAATAPTTTSTPTIAQSTGAATQPAHTTPPAATAPPETTHKHPIEERVHELERKLREGKLKPASQKPASPVYNQSQVPPKERYPTELQDNFTSLCRAGHGSAATCECILVKLEISAVEKGRSVAELLALNVALEKGASMQLIVHHGVKLPRRVRADAEQCINA